MLAPRMTDREGGGEGRTALEKALGLVTDVRAGEGVTALLLTLNLFLLLTAYYVIKPVRDTLIVSVEHGPEYKSYMGGAIAIALLFAVPAYARIAERLPRNRLLIGVSLFFASNLVGFFFLNLLPPLQSGAGGLAFALGFFLWVGVFNMMIIAQFWAFANDLYTDEQGKRLFALVGLGASVGSAVGSMLIARLVDDLGIAPMFLVCAALLGASAFLIQVAHVRETHRAAGATTEAEKARVAELERERAEEAKKARPKGRDGSFAMVWKHRYLALLAAFSVVFTLVNTNGEYILGRLVKDFSNGLVASGVAEAQAKTQVAAFYGSFYLWVNVLGVVLQALVVSRIIKYGGLKIAMFVLPIVALADATAIALFPILAIARYGKVAENAFDYSLNNTVRNTLWLPTTRRMKYLAKQAVDTFFVRMGDVGSALVVLGLVAGLGFGVRAMALANVALIVVWLALAWAIVRENARMVARKEAGELPDEEEPTA
jgi:AAA family ATP:ADP antiporter